MRTDAKRATLPSWQRGSVSILARQNNYSTDVDRPFDLQPNLKGELLELRPLRPDDFDDLYAVASDPLIWEQHPVKERIKKRFSEAFSMKRLNPAEP